MKYISGVEVDEVDKMVDDFTPIEEEELLRAKLLDLAPKYEVECETEIATPGPEKKKRKSRPVLTILVSILMVILLGIVIDKLVLHQMGAIKANDDVISSYDEKIKEKIQEISSLNETTSKLNKEINELNKTKEDLIAQVGDLEGLYVKECWVPEGYGSIHSVMNYRQDWTPGTAQYEFHNTVQELIWLDQYGYARIGDRYLVAVKPYYGNVGDYINVYQEDGSLIKCIIGDNKGMENPDIYYHTDGSVVEFMVDLKNFTTVAQTHPEFCKNIRVIKTISKKG